VLGTGAIQDSPKNDGRAAEIQDFLLVVQGADGVTGQSLHHGEEVPLVAQLFGPAEGRGDLGGATAAIASAEQVPLVVLDEEALPDLVERGTAGALAEPPPRPDPQVWNVVQQLRSEVPQPLRAVSGVVIDVLDSRRSSSAPVVLEEVVLEKRSACLRPGVSEAVGTTKDGMVRLSGSSSHSPSSLQMGRTTSVEVTGRFVYRIGTVQSSCHTKGRTFRQRQRSSFAILGIVIPMRTMARTMFVSTTDTSFIR
jgi:hypothetical protein